MNETTNPAPGPVNESVSPAAPAAPPPRAWLRYGVVPTLAILAIAGAVWWVNKQDAPAGSSNALISEALGDTLEAGKPAPSFTAPGVNGPDLRLADQRGKVTLVNFWATWCGPCRAEMPDLNAVYNEYKDRGFVVIGMNYQESAGDVQKFTGELGVSFPLGRDADGTIARSFHVHGFPTSYFIDQQGRISEVHVGALNRELVTQRLQQLLKGA